MHRVFFFSLMGLPHSPTVGAVKLPSRGKSTTFCTCCVNYYLLFFTVLTNCRVLTFFKDISDLISWNKVSRQEAIAALM
jgi:hypothetical protein